MRKPITLSPILLLILLAGCQVSPAFQSGAAAIGPRLSAEAYGYVAKDSTSDAPTKEMRAAQAAQLKADTSVVKAVSRAAVEGSWGDVRPWLLAYYSADAKLSTDEKKVRNAMAAEMDKLLADEKSRPFSK
jgi:hypothetical protein